MARCFSKHRWPNGAHGEGVTAQHIATLAVANLHGGHNHIERRQGLLDLQPLFAAPPRLVGRGWIFDHQPLVAARPRPVEQRIDLGYVVAPN